MGRGTPGRSTEAPPSITANLFSLLSSTRLVGPKSAEDDSFSACKDSNPAAKEAVLPPPKSASSGHPCWFIKSLPRTVPLSSLRMNSFASTVRRAAAWPISRRQAERARTTAPTWLNLRFCLSNLPTRSRNASRWCVVCGFTFVSPLSLGNAESVAESAEKFPVNFS